MPVVVLDEADLKELTEGIINQTIEKYDEERSNYERPLKLGEIAEYLEVSEATMIRELHSDDPPPFGLVRGMKRFYKRDVDEWVRRRGTSV